MTLRGMTLRGMTLRGMTLRRMTQKMDSDAYRRVTLGKTMIRRRPHIRMILEGMTLSIMTLR
jgi:hypothetical protein